MARLPRLSFAGLPHHVIQRGHNSQPIFLEPADYQFMLELMAQYARDFDIAVHGYVLMPNHFHLLLTPRAADGLPRMLQALGRRYVRYFNDAQSRTGTLWDGRYRCTVVQPERYLLPCMVNMDTNPIRAGLVATVAEYAWSSYRHYAGQVPDKIISPHAQFWGLGNTPFSREAAYADLVQSGICPDQQQVLTDSTLKGWALGDDLFVQKLQKQTTRRLAMGKPGRPMKATNQ